METTGHHRGWSTLYSVGIAVVILAAYIAGYIWLYLLAPGAATVVLGVHLVIIAAVLAVGIRHRNAVEAAQDQAPTEPVDLVDRIDLRSREGSRQNGAARNSAAQNSAGTTRSDSGGVDIAPVVRLDRVRAAHQMGLGPGLHRR